VEVFHGLTAAFSWGVADFLSRFAARAVGLRRSLFWSQAVGLAALSLFLVASGGLSPDRPRAAYLSAAALALLNTLGTIALTEAFRTGVLTLVSPIAGSFGAVTALLAFASGERLAPVTTAGVAATLVGLALAAAAPGPPPADVTTRHWRGVGCAAAAALCFGIVFWLLGFEVTPALGGVLPVWIFRLATVTLLCAMGSPRALGLPGMKVLPLLVLIGLLDTTAYVSVALGTVEGHVSVVTVLASLFSAVTVLLALALLREALRPHQWVGVALILCGVVLVNA
jgi:drug/metabolite transporter (DMT)-like permease